MAIDSNFNGQWVLRGNAVAEITNISLPGLSLMDSAVVNIYQWVSVKVFDGTSELLPGALVRLTPIHGSVYTGMTGNDGKATFQVLSNVLRAGATPSFIGSYLANATYTYNAQVYSGVEDKPVSLSQYISSQPIVRQSSSDVSIFILDALPDLDPPLFVSTTTPARNQTVTVSTEVSNIGVVPAHNVLVMFNDTGSKFYQYTITEIHPGEKVYVNTTWIAGYPLGVHNLTVAIDPYGSIKEMNNHNNDNYTLVTVMGIADLSVQRSDVTLSPASPQRGQATTISALINNSGDIDAANVNVSFYVTSPNGSTIFLGDSFINRIGHGVPRRPR